jgi:hypothetical protein
MSDQNTMAPIHLLEVGVRLILLEPDKMLHRPFYITCVLYYEW